MTTDPASTTPAQAMEAFTTVFDEPVAVGQWRVWNDARRAEGDPYVRGPWKVDSLYATQANETRADILAHSRVLHTPHEVVDAYLASRPEEERARVTLDAGDGGRTLVEVDGSKASSYVLYEIVDVGQCLTWLRAELAKPPASKPRTRTEPARSALIDGLERRIAELEARNDVLARERDFAVAGQDAYVSLYGERCDELMAVTSERDALKARVETEHDRQWLATYNAALKGIRSNPGVLQAVSNEKAIWQQCAADADALHGARKKVTRE